MMEFRRSMGKKFEERGDYRNALRSYEAAGLEEGAERMRKLARALDMADVFMSHGEFGRMAELLVESNLQKKGLEYLKKLENIERDHRATYAKAVICAANGLMRESLGCIRELMECNYWTRYLAGRTISRRDAKFAEKIADYLSRKNPDVYDLADGFAEFARKRGFLDKDDKSQVEVLASLMEVYEEDEGTFYALEIYKKLGRDDEAERCLERLGSINRELYLFGVAALKGREGIMAVEEAGLLHATLLQVTSGNIDGMLEKMEQAALEDCQEAIEALSNAERWLPGSFSHEQAARLCAQEDRIGDMRAEVQEIRLEEFEMLLRGSMEDIKRAEKLLGEIKLEHLYRPPEGEPYQIHRGRWELYNRYILQAADAAFRFRDNPEALIFASGIYSRRDSEKALDCADCLYMVGEREKAKWLYGNAARRISETEDGKERLAALALGMETKRPGISMVLYDYAGGREGMIRMASLLIESNDIADVEQAAWRLTTDDKLGMLLKNALDKLETFGDEGKAKADGIRLEMGIGHLFRAK